MSLSLHAACTRFALAVLLGLLLGLGKLSVPGLPPKLGKLPLPGRTSAKLNSIHSA